MKWGMNIIDPLLWAPGKAQFILLKWVEAQAFQKVLEKEVIEFIWDHIICRFGISIEIFCGNGKQFVDNKLSKLFEDHKVKKILSTPYHPSRKDQA